jgi:lysylphosphatidylglycerol synthetase-like protein (DUF2156 family)
VVPIELVWFIVVLIFALVGIVRGYLKELGVTTVMVVVLFAIITFEGRLVPVVIRLVQAAGEVEVVVWQTALWAIGLVFAAFISYQGETLAFEGKQPKSGMLAMFLNASSGLVNGYLIAGGIWYYVDRLGYPFLGLKPEHLTPFARQLLLLMPQTLLAPYLLYIAVFLVLMRVIR